MDEPVPENQAGNELRAFLAVRNVACPGCGYNLRGLASSACPECNQGLVLRVGLSEPRLGLYLFGLSGLLGGASLAAVFWLAVAIIAITEKDWPSGHEFFPVVILPLIMAGAEGLLAVLLGRARGRVWYRAHGSGGRIRIAALCWLLTAGFVTVFMAWLFRWV